MKCLTAVISALIAFVASGADLISTVGREELEKRIYAIAALATLFVCGTAAASTYVVYPDPLIGDFPTIQAAVDYVRDGDVIELADGIFRGEGNRDIDYLGKAITIRSQSGDPQACVVDCGGDYHFGFAISFVGSDAVLEGVTILNAYHTYGGAVYLEDSSPMLTNCIFEDSFADMGAGVLVNGPLAYPTIVGCTFISNEARSAGGGLCI